MPTTMRYLISLELNGALGDSYKQLRHTLEDDFRAEEALKGLWIVNWGKRTRTGHILSKITPFLGDEDRAMVIALDTPEWFAANLAVDAENLPPLHNHQDPKQAGPVLQGSDQPAQ